MPLAFLLMLLSCRSSVGSNHPSARCSNPATRCTKSARRSRRCRKNVMSLKSDGSEVSTKRGLMDYGDRVASRRSSAGFTLGELMVVVGIVGLLAAIAYPSYASYVKRSNRAFAQQLMLNISNREEHFLLDAKAYTA